MENPTQQYVESNGLNRWFLLSAIVAFFGISAIVTSVFYVPSESQTAAPGMASILPVGMDQPAPQFVKKNIEDIRAGDTVWSYDHQSQTWSQQQVIRPLVHNFSGDLVTVTVGGHTIQATANHPFWVAAGENLSARPPPRDVPASERDMTAKGRWVDAGHLEAGDTLVAFDGGLLPIDMVTVQRVSTKVYNIQVQNLHTYAVGDLGIAVHNKPCFPPGTLVLMADGSAKPIESISLGDQVMAADPKIGSGYSAETIGLIRDFAAGLVHISFQTPRGNETTITPTRFHPMWTNDRGWVLAKDLVAGDVLRDAQNDALRVVRVRFEAGHVRTYNLSIAGVHTFYALAADRTPVLVHNAIIYRSVGPGELETLGGGYTPSPGGLEVKYFYPTAEQASRYASNPVNEQIGPFTLTSTDAPTSIIDQTGLTPVAGEGSVITVPNELLPELPPPTIYDSMPLPAS